MNLNAELEHVLTVVTVFYIACMVALHFVAVYEPKLIGFDTTADARRSIRMGPIEAFRLRERLLVAFVAGLYWEITLVVMFLGAAYLLWRKDLTEERVRYCRQAGLKIPLLCRIFVFLFSFGIVRLWLPPARPKDDTPQG